MKHLLILFTLMSSFSLTNAQQWLGSTNQNNLIYRNGEITASDGGMYRVSIGSGYEIDEYGGRGYLGFNLRRDNSGQWAFLGDGVMNDGAAIIHGWNSLLFSIKGSNGVSGGTLTDGDVANDIKMKIQDDGKVVIGNVSGSGTFTNYPDGYKLYVEDGIITERLKVAVHNSADWSDYVFKSDYKLLPLNQLRSYINSNKHLPGVPSANDVVSNGIDVAKMDAILLQKIEELTLYILDLKDENKALYNRVEALEKNN